MSLSHHNWEALQLKQKMNHQNEASERDKTLMNTRVSLRE